MSVRTFVAGIIFSTRAEVGYVCSWDGAAVGFMLDLWYVGDSLAHHVRFVWCPGFARQEGDNFLSLE